MPLTRPARAAIPRSSLPSSGGAPRPPRHETKEADFERVVPLFYRDRERFIDVVRHAIALTGSFFNTQRMVEQYVRNAYFPAASLVEEAVG